MGRDISHRKKKKGGGRVQVLGYSFDEPLGRKRGGRGRRQGLALFQQLFHYVGKGKRKKRKGGPE